MSEEPVAIEIGPRNLPLITQLKSDLLPSQPGKILYIEKGASWLGTLARNVSKDNKIMQGDASKLALAPNSTNLLFLKDVIGSQGQPEYIRNSASTKLGKTGGVSNIASELSRVTRAGGKVVILETATPYDKDEITAEFSANNFVLQKNLDRESIKEIFEDPVLGSGIANAGDRKSYALVFEKI